MPNTGCLLPEVAAELLLTPKGLLELLTLNGPAMPSLLLSSPASYQMKFAELRPSCKRLGFGIILLKPPNVDDYLTKYSHFEQI